MLAIGETYAGFPPPLGADTVSVCCAVPDRPAVFVTVTATVKVPAVA